MGHGRWTYERKQTIGTYFLAQIIINIGFQQVVYSILGCIISIEALLSQPDHQQSIGREGFTYVHGVERSIRHSSISIPLKRDLGTP